MRATRKLRSSSRQLTFRCNGHILGLGQRIKQSLQRSGVTGYQFGTVGVSDGISMGTRGSELSTPGAN